MGTKSHILHQTRMMDRHGLRTMSTTDILAMMAMTFAMNRDYFCVLQSTDHGGAFMFS
jgi:hypothetical protein